MPYFWIKERRNYIEEAFESGVNGWNDVIVYLKEEKGIKTTANTLRQICINYKIKRPVFPAGGDRRSKEYLKQREYERSLKHREFAVCQY